MVLQQGVDECEGGVGRREVVGLGNRGKGVEIQVQRA